MEPVEIQTPSHGNIYSEDQVREIAKILGGTVKNKKNFQQLYEQLERAAFDYLLTFEDKNEEPTEPASKLLERVTVPSNAIQNAINHISNFPRKINGDLLIVANKVGDEVGRKRGAADFQRTFKEMQWVVKCLDELAGKYSDDIVEKGGNREDVGKRNFYEDLIKIVEELHDGPLTGSFDHSKNKKIGPLPEFLEICFSPIPAKASLDTITRTYKSHVKSQNRF